MTAIADIAHVVCWNAGGTYALSKLGVQLLVEDEAQGWVER